MARLLFDLKNKKNNKNKTRQTKHRSVLVCDSFYLRIKYKFNNTLLQTGNLIMKLVDCLTRVKLNMPGEGVLRKRTMVAGLGARGLLKRIRFNLPHPPPPPPPPPHSLSSTLSIAASPVKLFPRIPSNIS